MSEAGLHVSVAVFHHHEGALVSFLDDKVIPQCQSSQCLGFFPAQFGVYSLRCPCVLQGLSGVRDEGFQGLVLRGWGLPIGLHSEGV